MTKEVTAAGLAWARRHPRRVGQGVAFAARHRRGVREAVTAIRRAARVLSHLERATGDPTVQREARLTASSLGRALDRSRRLGLARALDDHDVIDQLRSAAEHGSNLVTAAERPLRRRQSKKATIGIASLLLAGGVAYAGWRASLPSGS